MIYNFNYSNSSNRQHVLSYLKEKKFKATNSRIIIVKFVNSWLFSFIRNEFEPVS